MAHRLHRPPGPPACRRPIAPDIGELSNEAQTPFNIRKFVNHDLQRERARADLLAQTSQLRHPPLIPQKKVLHAVACLENRLSALKRAKRNDMPEPRILAASDVGGKNAPIVLSPPEHICFESIPGGVGERYKGPRPRHALNAAVPGAKPFGCSRCSAAVFPARICASHVRNRDAVGDTPKPSAIETVIAHSHSLSVAARRKPWGRETPPSSCSPSRDDGGRYSQRHKLKQAPPLCALSHAARARCSTYPRFSSKWSHNLGRKTSTTS